MPYTEPPVFVTGTKPTAAWLNSYVSDNLDYLKMARMKWAQRIAVGAWTTNSLTYVDWLDAVGGNPLTMHYTKLGGTESRLFVFVYITTQVNTTAHRIDLAVSDGVADRDCHPRKVFEVGSHKNWLCRADPTALNGPAGIYRLRLRVKVNSTAVFTVTAAEDFAAMRVFEAWD